MQLVMQIQIYKKRTHKSTYILQCISTSTATRLVNIMNFVPVWIEKCAFAELTVLEYTVRSCRAYEHPFAACLAVQMDGSACSSIVVHWSVAEFRYNRFSGFGSADAHIYPLT